MCISVFICIYLGINQWYKRDEKNPWRPIAFQVINDIFSSASSNRDDINTKKKKKKQEWNSKVYKMAINEKIALKKNEKIKLENEKNEKINEIVEFKHDRRIFKTNSDSEINDSMDSSVADSRYISIYVYMCVYIYI
jgi:hypothetical protein